MNLTNTDSNPFWEFSLAIYAQPGVAAACLELQESEGVDVNVLMYVCWCARQGCALGAAQLSALETVVADWRRDVVLPIRLLRQGLRKYPGIESTRAVVKQAELEAERVQQQKMYAHSGPLVEATGRQCLHLNLTRFSRFYGCDANALDGLEQVVLDAIRNLPADL